MDSKATSDYRKFDPYLFNVNNEYSHKKEKTFNSWGYSVEDARWLQQEMDVIEVIVEKKRYTDDGVHMGMHDWICAPEHTNDYWLVNFPQCGEHEDIATIGIHEKDMKKIPMLDAMVNEEIAARYRKED